MSKRSGDPIEPKRTKHIRPSGSEPSVSIMPKGTKLKVSSSVDIVRQVVGKPQKKKKEADSNPAQALREFAQRLETMLQDDQFMVELDKVGLANAIRHYSTELRLSGASTPERKHAVSRDFAVPTFDLTQSSSSTLGTPQAASISSGYNLRHRRKAPLPDQREDLSTLAHAIEKAFQDVFHRLSVQLLDNAISPDDASITAKKYYDLFEKEYQFVDNQEFVLWKDSDINATRDSYSQFLLIADIKQLKEALHSPSSIKIDPTTIRTLNKIKSRLNEHILEKSLVKTQIKTFLVDLRTIRSDIFESYFAPAIGQSDTFQTLVLKSRDIMSASDFDLLVSSFGKLKEIANAYKDTEEGKIAHGQLSKFETTLNSANRQISKRKSRLTVGFASLIDMYQSSVVHEVAKSKRLGTNELDIQFNELRASNNEMMNRYPRTRSLEQSA